MNDSDAVLLTDSSGNTDRYISILGDSISTFEGAIPKENRCYYDGVDSNSTGVDSVEDTWWMQVIEFLGARLLANASFSGSTVEGRGFPAGCSARRAEQLLGQSGEMPDDVLVFMGINDYGWAGADAQAAANSEAASFVVEDVSTFQNGRFLDGPGAATKTTIPSFEKSYSEMLSNIKKVAPDATIWCISLVPGRVAGCDCNTFCYRLRGESIDAYNAAIASAAERNGCEFLDIRSCGFDYESKDGTHPTPEGMRQIAAMVFDSMSNDPKFERYSNTVSELDLKSVFPKNLESECTCDKTDCLSCEFAQGTGNAWSCVCRKNMDREVR